MKTAMNTLACSGNSKAPLAAFRFPHILRISGFPLTAASFVYTVTFKVWLGARCPSTPMADFLL